MVLSVGEQKSRAYRRFILRQLGHLLHETRRFPPPSHGGFGFFGSASLTIVYQLIQLSSTKIWLYMEWVGALLQGLRVIFSAGQCGVKEEKAKTRVKEKQISHRVLTSPTNGEYQLRHRSEHYQRKASVSVGIGQADISNPMSQGIFLRLPFRQILPAKKVGKKIAMKMEGPWIPFGALRPGSANWSYSRKLSSRFRRAGRFSFLSAFASICRMRSRVSPKTSPTSSRV